MNQPSITWRSLDLPGHFKVKIHGWIEIEIRVEGGPMPFQKEQNRYTGWLKTSFSDWELLENSFLSIEELKSVAIFKTSRKLLLFSKNIEIQATWEQK